jgi:hypothetical protein
MDKKKNNISDLLLPAAILTGGVYLYMKTKPKNEPIILDQPNNAGYVKDKVVDPTPPPLVNDEYVKVVIDPNPPEYIYENSWWNYIKTIKLPIKDGL